MAEVSAIHKPVLLRQAIEVLQPKENGHYLDGTLGLGGHSQAILDKAATCELCAIDRDSEALELAKLRLSAYGNRVHYFHMPFAEFTTAIDELGWQKIDGAILDLGVSSMQLDNDRRGFSFNSSGPLDMRMDQKSEQKSAWSIVNGASFEELKNYIEVYGEDPQAGRIARHIVEARKMEPIDNTKQLAEIVCQAYPAAWRRKARRHPATRVFQALRMVVNGEQNQLKIFMDNILARLAVGGRLVIISFHSIEDRIVKNYMRKWASRDHDCSCRLLFKKPLVADDKELAENPRASSAKMRALEKTAEIAQ